MGKCGFVDFSPAKAKEVLMNRKADRVYVNGKVYTVDANDSVQSAFCVKDDRFVAVGTEEEVLKYCD